MVTSNIAMTTLMSQWILYHLTVILVMAQCQTLAVFVNKQKRKAICTLYMNRHQLTGIFFLK